MHIGFNAHLLSPEAGYRQAGVSSYIDLLLRELWQSATGRPPHARWTIYTPPGISRTSLGAPQHVQVRTSSLSTTKPLVRIAWEQFIAPAALLHDQVDVLFCPLNVVPLLAPCPTVVTVHDLAFLRFDLHKPAKRRYLAALTRLSVGRARHVITVSEFTRLEVLELLKIGPQKVTAIPNGRDERFQPADATTIERFRQSNELPPRFVLFVGTLEPRKNVTTLIEAYARARAHLDMPLVIAGGKGWRYDDIFARVQALGLDQHVRFTGFVARDELPLYYAAATVLVYPSLYEGFGFPPLEALAMGTPVITSNAASLPEVVGDAALLVPPKDVDALAEALVRIINDQELRLHLRARGLQQAKRFSWARAADQTLDVLHRIYG